MTCRHEGVNLEAVDPEFKIHHNDICAMKTMRSTTADNAQKLLDMGYDFIVLTGNPNNGVSN
ncbi:DUF7916 family protein [Vibrio crassostreae]|uniref:DUF7916 family protein n=1 Tax=Vibrio crassostreae TaxID=246167 RepID=UPI003F68B700